MMLWWVMDTFLFDFRYSGKPIGRARQTTEPETMPCQPAGRPRPDELLSDLLRLKLPQPPRSVDLGCLLLPALARLLLLCGAFPAAIQRNLGLTLAVPITAVDAF